MKKIAKTSVALFAAFVMAVTGASVFNGIFTPIYAEVGSVADDEDVEYDKDGGVLNSLGIDTSQMPADYDPNSTENPYGSDMTTLNTVKEMALFETTKEKSYLYGHNTPLNGKYSTFENSHITCSAPFLTTESFAECAACDINGNGRDSALAIVYTNYHSTNYDPAAPEKNNIYMTLYDAHSGNYSDPIVISNYIEDRITEAYLVQSQLQITCGDYDNDTVDEIAVYVPATTDNERAKVAVYDLVNGKDSADPFSASAWQLSWNYFLPVTSAASEVVAYMGHEEVKYFRNFYNNIDLVSGDADNDGPCDLIISYGASSTGSEIGGANYAKIIKSIPSKSVLLYGSNTGKMLKKSQSISYDGNELIRVSFAFGDLDDDGNEEMLMGGQLMDEQAINKSRVLGKYLYDDSSDKMVPEVIQNMDVIEGTVEDGKWSSANGWDENYYSVPVMKANIAVGKFYGEQSNSRIYMDSVLYSYDNVFSIEDELEDLTTEDDNQGRKIPRGSQAMADIKHGDKQWEYFEFGAEAANYTGGAFDYALIHRISKPKQDAGAAKIEANATKLVVEGEDLDNLKMEGKNMGYFYGDSTKSTPFIMASPDTDIDGNVAEYTGNHSIKYDNPRVDAVLVSAPYFKDVAAYDEGGMLSNCSTGYGHGTGTDNGYEHSVSFEVGLHVDIEDGGFFSDGDTGFCLSSSWGENTTREFTISYEAAAGEDSVVLYSVPHEHFEYNLHGVTVDDDGNIEEYTEKMYITYPHQPVHQVLTVEDYMEIQKEYAKILPDVTEYYSSKPGDPSSYPKNEDDMPERASKNLKYDTTQDETPLKCAAEEFEGIGYGGGKITQSFTTTHTESKSGDNVMTGGFTNFDVGGGGGIPNVWSLKIGLHVALSGEEGSTYSTSKTDEYSCSVANMPRSAKDYGYDFSWKLFEYNVNYSVDSSQEDEVKEPTYYFPIVTYIVNDVLSPPTLPEKIDQDFDKTTDSQTALTWTYNTGVPQEFQIYKHEDFPIGGGDLLVGTVAGSNYKIKKDENGNTLKDENNNIIHEYTFLDSDLTADTKYQYRVKVKRSQFPQESIFSPIVEARTKVSQNPDVRLSSDDLKIYPDGVYRLSVVLADPESYEGAINYQWQKYDKKKRVWDDVADCTKKTIAFYKCDKQDEGTYRCRVNLIRKVEGHPQYISAFTNSCVVDYSKRTVKFSDLSVFEGTGSSPINTGVSVKVANDSTSSAEKPTGAIQFRIEGANATFLVSAPIDEATGIAKVNSLEDGMGSSTMKSFTDGGYKVTASYGGSAIFYAADDPDDYHYLRNIEECMWLSARSSYIFGEDIMKTTKLYDYQKSPGGMIIRTDKTEQIKKIKFYMVGSDGKKFGDPVAIRNLEETGGTATLPLNKALAKSACIEVFGDDPNEPLGTATFKTEKMITKLQLGDRLTGTGSLLEFFSTEDIVLSGDGNLTEQNIFISHNPPLPAVHKSLADLIKFRYYEANGDYMFDSDTAEQHRDEFAPAEYTVKLDCPDPISTFYKLKLEPGEFTVVGNYYKVKASCSDENAGVISMLSPDKKAEYVESGFAGGTKLVFKALPDKGYQVKRWKINECGENEYVESGSDMLIYTVKSANTVGTGEVTITAVLAPKNNTLIYDTMGRGAVEVTPQIESGSTVIADTDLSFKATPASGWKFVEWKWINEGGKNSIAKGVAAEDGTNTKTFTMPDNAATVYGVFMRDTIDIDLQGQLNASYVNDGSNPLEETGKEVKTDSGQDVPKGSQVIISTKKGFALASDAEWKVTITTPDRTYDAEVEECIVDGQDGCKFALPDDVTACQVAAKTEQGRFSVDASADDVQFEIKVDGVLVEESAATHIEAGTDIEVKAKPDRGKVLDSWIINGETLKSKDTLYTTSITDNLSISASTADDQKLNLKLKTSGGGTGQYTITDKSGRTYTETFGGTEITPDLYKGETLTLTSGDSHYTLTAVSINGRNTALDDDQFVIKDIAEDNDIICRFTSSTFCNIGFTRQPRKSEITIMDSDGFVLDEDEGIAVPYGSDTSFKVVLEKGYDCFIYDGDSKIEYASSEDYDSGHKIYTYQIDGLERNLALIVRDYDTYYIENSQDLKNYFQLLGWYGTSFPDAIVKNDITMDPSDCALPYCSRQYAAVFDGRGHTISNIELSPCLFLWIGPTGVIKDVVLENVTGETAEWETNASGIITDDNQGTISGVELRNAEIRQTANTARQYNIAGIAGTNAGTIKDCKVSGLKLLSATPDFDEPIGCAGVIINDNNAIFENNYFEDVMRTTSGGLLPATDHVVSPENAQYGGEYKNNYFRTTYAATDPHGANVCTLTEHPEDEVKAIAEIETPAFARKLAYTMNKQRGDKIWGIGSNNDTAFTQITIGGKDCKAPVRTDFRTTGQSVTMYLYPDQYQLPGRDTFGDNTPIAWENDSRAYAPDYKYVNISKDSDFTGVESTADYAASIETPGSGAMFFKNLDDALDAAAHHDTGTTQNLNILSACAMADRSFTIDKDTVMTLTSGAKLTMKKSASIINNGSIVCADGSEMHKYGTIQNKGSIDVAGSFYNYGTKLSNSGTITNQAGIICKPHRSGEWKQAEEPNDDGTWTLISTCEVCTKDATETIDPNPPYTQVESIRLLAKPDKDVYEVGETFTDEGMKVIALLNDGRKAVITEYTITVDGKELHNGDTLDTEGAYNATVSYKHFTCGFDIDVIDTANLLAITDGGGNEVTEIEMKVNDLQELNAELKHSTAQATGFRFETSDPEVVSIDNNTLEFSHNVLALKPGTASIMVTVVDENEDPVAGIQPKSVEITVLDHITEIELLGGDKVLDIGDAYQLKARVVPEDTTDKVSWRTSDESVVTVDDTGFITAVGSGKAVITVASPDDISSSINVIVYEKAGILTMDSSELEIAANRFAVLAARVEPATANGMVTWSVDDSNIAGFYVRDKKTGEMKVVQKTTTQLFADGSEYADAYVIISGAANGETIVKATTEGMDGSVLEQECRVTVSDTEEHVSITQNGAIASGETMKVNIDERIIQFGVESSVEGDALTWSVIDDGQSPVIEVNSMGKVTLLRTGNAVLKVTSEITGATDVCALKVKRNATGVVLSDKAIRLAEGEKQVLIGTLQPSDAEDNIIWTSSDKSVATVSSNGTVKAISDGEAVITARPDNQEAEADTCIVTVYEPFLTLKLSKTLYTYNGKMHYPSVTVKTGHTILGKGLTKSNNKVILAYDGGRTLPGMYTVTAVANNKSYGFGTSAYKIQVKPTKIKKLKKGKKSFTVKWKKVGKTYITGYQVKYSPYKDFKKSKIKTIKKYKTTSKKIKGLKAKKKYYVKVRTYVKKGKVKYYSSWSNVMTVVPKKK